MPPLSRSACFGAVLAVIMMAGCGKVGDPLPPFIRIPMPASDLSVEQRGYTLYLTWTNPLRHVDGSTPADVALVRIRSDGGRVSEVAPGPAGQPQGLELDAAGSVGDTLVFTVLFETPEGRLSQPSNPASIEVVEVPGRVEFLRTIVDEGRILLDWEPPREATRFADGYRLYRSGVLLTPEPIAETRYADRAYTVGESYSYRLVPVRRVQEAWREGLALESINVVALDRTPPAPPSGLRLTPAPDGAFVEWEASPEADVVRYTVFLKDEESAGFRRLEESRATTAYFDPDHRPGRHYAVSAIDRSGNESARSASLVSPPQNR